MHEKSISGGFCCGIFYLITGIIGIAGHGIYEDLVIWSGLSIIFSIVFIVESVVMIKQKKNEI